MTQRKNLGGKTKQNQHNYVRKSVAVAARRWWFGIVSLKNSSIAKRRKVKRRIKPKKKTEVKWSTLWSNEGKALRERRERLRAARDKDSISKVGGEGQNSATTRKNASHSAPEGETARD